MAGTASLRRGVWCDADGSQLVFQVWLSLLQVTLTAHRARAEGSFCALSLSLICSSLISCCMMSGSSASSKLNGMANTFSSLCLLFMSWNVSPKCLKEFCTEQAVCCSPLQLHFSTAVIALQIISHSHSREPRSWLRPWMLTFSKFYDRVSLHYPQMFHFL